MVIMGIPDGSIAVGPTLINTLVVPEVSVCYVIFIFSYDLIKVMAIQAKVEVLQVFQRMIVLFRWYCHRRSAIYLLQPVTVAISINYLTSAFIKIIGSLFMINMSHACIMTVQAFNGLVSSMSAGIVKVNIRGTHAIADRNTTVVTANTPLFFPGLQGITIGFINPTYPVGLGHGYTINDSTFAVTVVAHECVFE
jgi:hypothetical protein